MQKFNEMQDAQQIEPTECLPWIKPVVQKIRAGDAEIGTRTTDDGAFTTS
jgi:hypothetical protein